MVMYLVKNDFKGDIILAMSAKVEQSLNQAAAATSAARAFGLHYKPVTA